MLEHSGYDSLYPELVERTSSLLRQHPLFDLLPRYSEAWDTRLYRCEARSLPCTGSKCQQYNGTGLLHLVQHICHQPGLQFVISRDRQCEHTSIGDRWRHRDAPGPPSSDQHSLERCLDSPRCWSGTDIRSGRHRWVDPSSQQSNSGDR